MERQNSSAGDGANALEAVVVVPNKAGLHARSAAALVKECARFRSAVTLHTPNGAASTRSLMDLLRLAARQGDTLRIHVEGEDAEAALDAVRALLESGFGEK